ncbi:hypothetical protein PM082_023222 [Marasmius tenuissimus]|nr:hypothetical protein PM082_023222 [Marasmius tenuissimus]
MVFSSSNTQPQSIDIRYCSKVSGGLDARFVTCDPFPLSPQPSTLHLALSFIHTFGPSTLLGRCLSYRFLRALPLHYRRAGAEDSQIRYGGRASRGFGLDRWSIPTTKILVVPLLDIISNSSSAALTPKPVRSSTFRSRLWTLDPPSH